MMATESGALSDRRRMALALGSAAGAALLTLACIAPDTPGASSIYAWANVATSAAWVATGVLLSGRADQRGLSRCLIACGTAWALQWASTWDRGPLPVLGTLSNTVFYTVGGWSFLQYPRGVPRSSTDRIAMAGLLLLPLNQLALLAISDPTWLGFSNRSWWPHIATTRAMSDAWVQVIFIADAVIAAGYSVVILRRLRRLKGLDSLMTKPIAIGFCAVALISASSQGTELYPTTKVDNYYFVLAIVILAIPVGIMISITRRHLTHAAIASDLHRRFAQGALELQTITDALRAALRDQSLNLYYWSPAINRYADLTGTPISNALDPRRLVHEVRRSTGEPLALLDGDASLADHWPIVETALNASAMALENGQLQAEVRAQLAEVRRSRERIAEAAQHERTRIERDLHDGIQQRLLATITRLGIARRAGPQEQQDVLSQALRELRSTVDALRTISQGIDPPDLRQFGLRSAIQVLAEGMPITVIADVTAERFPPITESTAYAVVCEAFSNALKHSGASTVDVVIARCAEALRITVTDDGNGGIHRSTEGTGVAGLRDRVEASGGTFIVRGSTGAGSTVDATLPVVSPATS